MVRLIYRSVVTITNPDSTEGQDGIEVTTLGVACPEEMDLSDALAELGVEGEWDHTHKELAASGHTCLWVLVQTR